MSASTRDRPRTAPSGVSDATVQLGLRRRRSRRRFWLRIAVAVVALALVVTAGWLVGFSRVLAAEQVRLTGVAVASPARIEQVAAVPLGTPLARIDDDEIADRVATIPAVAAVTVTRDWPHTVRIAVTERTPVLKVTKGGAATWVDASGVAFHTGDSGSDASKDLLRADVSLEDRSSVAAAAAVADALPPSVASKVDVLVATSPQSIKLELDGRRQVVWGGSDQTELKAQVLTALLASKSTKDATVFDVSGPANPTTR